MPKDRYEILGTLGCGATSRVDKARDAVLGRTVALKTLVHAFGAPVEQKQFLREAQIVSQLSHPAISFPSLNRTMVIPVTCALRFVAGIPRSPPIWVM